MTDAPPYIKFDAELVGSMLGARVATSAARLNGTHGIRPDTITPALEALELLARVERVCRETQSLPTELAMNWRTKQARRCAELWERVRPETRSVGARTALQTVLLQCRVPPHIPRDSEGDLNLSDVFVREMMGEKVLAASQQVRTTFPAFRVDATVDATVTSAVASLKALAVRLLLWHCTTLEEEAEATAGLQAHATAAAEKWRAVEALGISGSPGAYFSAKYVRGECERYIDA